jgi:hypothetical protein
VPLIDDLRAQFKTAQGACEAYSREITEKYQTEMPNPAEWRGPGPDPEMAYARATAWTDEERAELARLRAEATRLAVEIDRARQAEASTSGD